MYNTHKTCLLANELNRACRIYSKAAFELIVHFQIFLLRFSRNVYIQVGHGKIFSCITRKECSITKHQCPIRFVFLNPPVSTTNYDL
jgi:hypothetical protein